MKNWTIGKRVAIGFTIMLAIPLVLGLFVRARVQAVQDKSKHVIKNGIPSLELLGGVLARLNENEPVRDVASQSRNAQDQKRLHDRKKPV